MNVICNSVTSRAKAFNESLVCAGGGILIEIWLAVRGIFFVDMWKKGASANMKERLWDCGKTWLSAICIMPAEIVVFICLAILGIFAPKTSENLAESVVKFNNSHRLFFK